MNEPISVCRRCKITLAPGEERFIPPLIRIPGALSLGPFHAGMWIWQELSLPYCARCRNWLSFLSILLGTIVLSLAVFAFRFTRKAMGDLYRK